MIAYEVTVDLGEDLVERYVDFMRTRHIPQVLATRCFAHAELDRSSETRFRMRYLAATLADLERYLEHHAPALREDYAKHFPTGTRVVREIWEEVNRWAAP